MEKKGLVLATNIASMICYVPVVGVIFILIEKEDRMVLFHAWQATIFGISWIAIIIGIEIISAILGAIVGFLGIVVGLFVPLIALFAIILWIICLVKAYQGEAWRIPVIGDYAAGKAGLDPSI